jgi:hypothetical protein
MYSLGTRFVSGICVWLPYIKETMMMMMMMMMMRIIIIIIIRMSVRSETTVVHGTGASVPTDLLATGILPKTLHKILIFKLQRRQLKQHSECLVQTTKFTDFSSLKIIIEKM